MLTHLEYDPDVYKCYTPYKHDTLPNAADKQSFGFQLHRLLHHPAAAHTSAAATLK